MKHNKIAFVTGIYTDTDFVSGGVKLNFLLLKKLHQYGFLIDLFTPKNVKIHSQIFTNVYKLKELDNLRKNYKLVLSDKAIVSSDITYIHDHSYLYRTEKMSNKFSHFFYKIFNKKRHKQRLQEFLKTKENIQKTNKVIVSSNILKQDMIKNYGVKEENIVIIPPPIEPYTNNNKQHHSVYTFGISALGFNRKGGYVMMKAIQQLKKKEKDFKVIFIYPSKNFGVEIIKKLYGIEKYCEFIPAQKDMSVFYNSIDCLVMPSLIEPFGMVATEALSLGCPVITGEHCGASDYITDGRNGYKYDFTNKSIKGLTYAMQKIIQNKSDFSQNCIASVQDQTLDIFVDKYIKVMESMN